MLGGWTLSEIGTSELTGLMVRQPGFPHRWNVKELETYAHMSRMQLCNQYVGPIILSWNSPCKIATHATPTRAFPTVVDIKSR